MSPGRLRHTVATLLRKAGVVPRAAQELMRHSPLTSLGADLDKLSRIVSLSNRDIRLTTGLPWLLSEGG
jgi:integrase